MINPKVVSLIRVHANELTNLKCLLEQISEGLKHELKSAESETGQITQKQNQVQVLLSIAHSMVCREINFSIRLTAYITNLIKLQAHPPKK